MVRIEPLPRPRKPVPVLSLKPAAGRTALSRFIRNPAKIPAKRKMS
ncbi:hypothetical protein SAMN04488245_101330 [Alloyangia pacifica]|uniref:Uncharacterized protein n=1 Tax=Alloyangia pacifica TaxID=311180 RepID=A0A1I6QTS3_9RHOB|nr:hypothetical protein SAMN04488245_101330 [Alloyangia pacifica]SFS55855.1 hypothetical protein SAMN04488050_102331 [Alloyangia pacifica]